MHIHAVFEDILEIGYFQYKLRDTHFTLSIHKSWLDIDNNWQFQL